MFGKAMKSVMGAGLLAVMLTLAFVLAAPGNATAAKDMKGADTNWSKQAEETFYLNPGMGSQVMNQDEWKKHSSKMQSMSESDRMSYRKEWHRKLMQEARTKGHDVPSVPPEHGKQSKEMGTTLLLIQAAGGTMGGSAGSGFGTGGTATSPGTTGNRGAIGSPGTTTGNAPGTTGTSPGTTGTRPGVGFDDGTDTGATTGGGTMDRDLGRSGLDRDMDTDFGTRRGFDRNMESDDFGSSEFESE